MEELKELLKDCFETGEELGLNADGRVENPLYFSYDEFYKANEEKINLIYYKIKEEGIKQICIK